MHRLKVMTVVGTRPEIIRLSEVIKACDRCFNHVLVHTGQNWDHALSQVFFDELGIRKPDYFLECADETLGTTIGNIIGRSYDVMVKEEPDALLVLGDTNSCLSVISAKRLKIPVFHMEAGNRCFDENVPEEINRRIVDHISDVNLPYTEHSRRYLLSEGIRKDFIFVTGSPMAEVLLRNRDRIAGSRVHETLGLESGKYFVVSAHREENIDHESNFFSLMNALNIVAEEYQLPLIYSTHPRSWKMIEQRGYVFHPLVRQVRPFGFLDYCRLQKDAYCVLSDSGTLSEESAIMGFPAVLIRTSTERPEALDKGTVILGGIKAEDILQAIRLCRETWENGDTKASEIPDYQDTNVSQKVVTIVQSYTKIINALVWRKEDRD
ncbi:MAG: non-hydrolyzing UDP-N-acetylglucosamine 2-epimerase [Bacillota bacterium]